MSPHLLRQQLEAVHSHQLSAAHASHTCTRPKKTLVNPQHAHNTLCYCSCLRYVPSQHRTTLCILKTRVMNVYDRQLSHAHLSSCASMSAGWYQQETLLRKNEGICCLNSIVLLFELSNKFHISQPKYRRNLSHQAIYLYEQHTFA